MKSSLALFWKKHLAKNKSLYFGFIDLEKAFDRMPCCVVWWTQRRLGVVEWLVKAVQAMHRNTISKVIVNHKYSKEFGIQVVVHQPSFPSHLLFIIVLQSIIEEFTTDNSLELLFVDGFTLIA